MKHNTAQRRINYPMLLKTIGWLLVIESVFMLIPMATAIVYGEQDWWAFAVAVAITLAAGIVTTRKIHPSHSHMARREGFLLTSAVWVIFSLFGMIPFLLSIKGVGFCDSYFEAMSGFTTTGATVLPSDTTISHGIHMWRALMQWIGGMGIILFTLAVVPMLNSSGGMQMFNAEVTGITSDKVRPRISQTAKALWTTYIVLTGLAAVSLWGAGMSPFDCLCHAFGTVSTGGYTTSAGGVEGFGSTAIYAILTVFMFLGGINFGLIIRCLYQGPKVIWTNEIFRDFIIAIGVIFLAFVAAIAVNVHVTSWDQLTVKPLFQIVSVATSTGYTVPGFATWGNFTFGLILVMMFVGGCAGSTSGGAKIDRVIFLGKYCRNEVYKCVRPNAVLSVRINNRIQPPEIVSKVVAFLCIFVLLVFCGAMCIMMFGEDPYHAFFSSFSCVTNTGLSAADTIMGKDFSEYPGVAKLIMSGLMLVGRLEIFTVLILFTPTFWRH